MLLVIVMGYRIGSCEARMLCNAAGSQDQNNQQDQYVQPVVLQNLSVEVRGC